LLDGHHFVDDAADAAVAGRQRRPEDDVCCTLTSHSYGTEWSLPLPPLPPLSVVGSKVVGSKEASKKRFITLIMYDANHCPGAAILVYRLSEETKWSVHCGDMRYHPKMKVYPLLRDNAGKIDRVFLDTTYGSNSKCEFLPQVSKTARSFL
jgi:hypothetical protein